jgi:hypothetical protein
VRSSQARSASNIAVPGCQGTIRSVDKSGIIAKSPYPRSHDDIAYPATVFMSMSTASK